MVEEWASMLEYHPDKKVFTEVAQWGADQELEACCEWLKQEREEPGWANRINLHFLRAARRPKPPTLKEQALKALEQLLRDPEAGCFAAAPDTIRRALEALPNG
jgi:hypothetical protein